MWAHFTILSFDLAVCSDCSDYQNQRYWKLILPFCHFTFWPGCLPWCPESGLLGAHFTILPFYLGVCSEVQNQGFWELILPFTIWPGGLVWGSEPGLLGAHFNILPFYHLTWGSGLRSRIRAIWKLIIPFYHCTISPGCLVRGPEQGLLGAHFTILPFYHLTWVSGLRSKIRAFGTSFYHFTIWPFDLGSCLRSRIWASES